MLYVQSAASLYAIGRQGVDRLLHDFGFGIWGLDLIDPPRLGIARGETPGTDIILDWPAPGIHSFILERSGSLSAQDWLDDPGAPVPVSGPGGRTRYQQVLAADAPQQLFRLRSGRSEQ